jgi:sugar lactone lactonase YvrE
MVVAPDGTIYIADTLNNRVVMVSPMGTEGAAPAATPAVRLIKMLAIPLNGPTGLVMDGGGYLHIADTGNNRVVIVAPTGRATVPVIPGGDLVSPQGIAVDQSGNMFIASTGNNTIVEVTPMGTVTVLPIAVGSGPGSLSGPKGLAFDLAGNLYIADSGNNRIVTLAPGSTSGVELVFSAMLAPSSLANPSGVAVDSLGNVYITDTGNNRIVQVDTSTPSRIGLGMNIGAYSLTGAKGVAVDILGTVYIADTGANRILTVAPVVNPSLVPTGHGYSLNQTAVNFGHVALNASVSVTLSLPFGVGSTALGTPPCQVFTQGATGMDFTLVAAGTTAVAGFANGNCTVEVNFLPMAPGTRTGSVVLYDGSGNPFLTVPLVGYCDAPVAALAPNTATVLNTGTIIPPLGSPVQVALDGSGNIFVADLGNWNVVKVAPGGGTAAVINTGAITLGPVAGVALDGAGNLFISDTNNNQIVVVTPGGVASVLTINGLTPDGSGRILFAPGQLCCDAAGSLYIADAGHGQIVKVSGLNVAGATSSGFGTLIGTGPYTPGSLTYSAQCMAVDPNGTIYIADSSNNQIIKVNAAGVVSLLNPGAFSFTSPTGVSADGFGNVFVADSFNNRILQIPTAGVATLVPIIGVPEDPGRPPHRSTILSTPTSVIVDPQGNLYIADTGGARVVCVNVGGANLSFASTAVGQTSTDSPQAATVTNLGNLDLLFSANPTYTADFSIDSSDTNNITAATTLGPGEVGDVSVNFTPQSPGHLSAGILVTDNALNLVGSTQQVSVSGLTPVDTTATTVSVNPIAPTSGQTVTLTATVSDTTAGNTGFFPAGLVTFTDLFGSTTTPLNGGAGVNLSSGTATLTGVSLTGIGSHTITASFGAGAFAASSNTLTFTLAQGQVASTVTLATSNTGTTAPGQPYAFTVTVTNSLGGTPGGNVTFMDGTTTLGTLALAGGHATFTISSLPVGNHSITASYAGDASDLSAVSSAIEAVITPDSTATTVSLSPSAPTSAQTVTLTATVLDTAAGHTSSFPVGSVTFTDHFGSTTTPLNGGAGLDLSSGTATLTGVSLTGIGSHTITASFSAGRFAASSNTLTFTLTLAQSQVASTVTLATSNTGTTAPGQPYAFTVTVANSLGGTPGGNVTFMDGTTTLGTLALAGGSATFTISSLSVGNHSITASYAGDANDLPAVSSAIAAVIGTPAVVVTTANGSSAITVAVADGGVATTQLTLTNQGLALGAPISFTASGLPQGATCAFDRTTVLVSSGPEVVNVTLTATPRLMIIGRIIGLVPAGGVGGVGVLFGGIFILPFARRRKRFGLFLSALALVLVGGMTACGTTNATKGITTGVAGTPAGTYPVTITATTPGATSVTTTINLTVN